jgi:replicative DNA helicase
MAIGGLIPTRLTTIGGRSGVGKSAITTQLFSSAARLVNGRRCEFLFFSWELDPSLIVDRAICNKAGVTLRMLNQGAKLLDKRTLDRINEAYRGTEGLPVKYQTMSLDIDNIRALCREFIDTCREKSKVEGVEIFPVAVIDYLNMAMFDGSGLRTYGIADFMNGFKQTLNETGMAGVVLAQLSRVVDKEKRLPDRSDFADSAAIENASDNLIVIHRPEYHNIPSIINPLTGDEIDSRNKILFRVLKGRDYGTGDFLMNCDVKHFRFWSLDHEWNTEYHTFYSDKDFWINQFGLRELQQEQQLTF